MAIEHWPVYSVQGTVTFIGHSVRLAALVRERTYCHNTLRYGDRAFMLVGSGAPLRWRKKTGGPMANKVVERIEARYEVQEVAFGTVYSWHPQSVLVECG